MPKGPQGQWRPADPVAAGVHIAKLATGEFVETNTPPASTTSPRKASQQAKKANAARNAKLSPARRREIARIGAEARWGFR